MSNKIENQWCVYKSSIWWLGFGKVEKESESCLEIRYSEGQLFPTQSWDPEFVKRFSTLEEAVDFYIEHRPGVDIREKDSTDKEIKELAKRKFPSYFKK